MLNPFDNPVYIYLRPYDEAEALRNISRTMKGEEQHRRSVDVCPSNRRCRYPRPR